MLGYRAGFWEDWIQPHKCTFDGANRLILVNPGVTELNILIDIYSDWKEWVQMYGNSKWFPAVSVVGGEPIPGGKTGSTFFLINGWKLVVDLSSVKVSGVLFSVDYNSAYFTKDLVMQYPAEVTSVVNTAFSMQNVISGTAESIAAAVRSVIAVELARLDISASASKTIIDLDSISEAVLAAAQTTPIHANTKQINDVVLKGTGVKDDEWGPV